MVNSNKQGKFKTYTLTGTTSGTGAIELPNYTRTGFIDAYYTDGTVGLIFRRDVSWLTCCDNYFQVKANTNVSILVSYFEV